MAHSNSQIDQEAMNTSSTLPKENLPSTNAKFYERPPISMCKALIENLSTNKRQRHPSWANKEKYNVNQLHHIRLITIGPSHFCEKARWALDSVEYNPSKPFYFTEDAHPPIFAGIATLEASDGEASMTPMVVYRNEKKEKIVLHDSSKIIQHLCPELYPDPIKEDIMQFESYLGTHLGATARVLLYHYMMEPPFYNALCKMICVHSSSIETFLWKKLFEKGLKRGMKKAMKINAESANTSLEAVRTVFYDLSVQLQCSDDNESVQQKKQYLMDTKDQSYGFTAADLTFAALAAPLIHPPELKSFIDVSDAELPKQILDLKYELRSTLAGQHVLEMYKKHRLGMNNLNQNNNNGVVVPKVVGRNRIPIGIPLAFGMISIGALMGRNGYFRSKL
jgi:glutathione S-transferase